MAPLSISIIYDECQNGVESHVGLLRSTKKLFAKCKTKDDVETFFEAFILCLKRSLIVNEQEPVVDTTLNFAAKFIVAMSAEGEAAEEAQGLNFSDNEEEEDLPVQSYFVKLCWSFFLEYHGVMTQAVRYRICQMIGKLLNSMDEDVQLSERLYGDLQRAMIARLSDKVPNVRAEAARALTRLQEARDDCPATKALLRHLGRDPNADVRRAILMSLVPSKKVVIAVLGRTLDMKENVRKAAYEYVAVRFHIRSLTIAQRVKLLKQGLKERSEIVQKVCRQTLIPNWCRMLGGDLLELLRCLDVQDASGIAELALVELFDKKCNADFITNFDLLGPDRLIREEALSAESVFYWRALCEYLKKNGDDDQYVDLLDRVLPDLPPLCDFINKYAQSINYDDDAMENLDKEFICEQLIRITDLYDLVDEAHRKFLAVLAKTICHSPKISSNLVSSAINIFKSVIRDPTERAHYLMEIIADIKEPIDVVDVALTAQEMRHADVAIANVRVEINVTRDEMEKYVLKQDFERAKDAKDHLNELEERIAQLIKDQQPKTQEIHVEKNDDFTMSKCLSIACGILEDPQCKLEISRIHSLIDNLILNCIKSADYSIAVRRMAVKALGLACQLNSDLACRHLFLFLQIIQLDAEDIRLMAFKSVFDLILIYGFDSFKCDEELVMNEQNITDADADASIYIPSSTDSVVSMDPTGKLLSILVAHLDSESTAVNSLVAEGLAKFLLSGRAVSAKIVSRLCIMYFSPVNSENNYLLSCLGEFFPLFAAFGVANRGMLADAFLPTLRLLFKAPASSPLSLINVPQLGAFFIQLTRPPPANQEKRAINPELYNPHDNLCIAICNEILRNPQHFGVPAMVDFFRLFHLSKNRKHILKDVSLLVKGIIKKLKDKRIINKLKRFLSEIQHLLTLIEPNDSLSEDECPRIVPETPDDSASSDEHRNNDDDDDDVEAVF